MTVDCGKPHTNAGTVKRNHVTSQQIRVILNVSPVYFVAGRKLGLEDAKIKKVWSQKKKKKKDGL